MAVAAWLAAGAGVLAQKPPLLAEKDEAAIANELSGETAKGNLEGIARFHRQRGSTGFHSTAELVAERLRAYGLSDVAILQFPADGKIFYGTQRSRPAWDAARAELWEAAWEVSSIPAEHSMAHVCCTARVKIADYEAQPIVLAEDSESTNVTANLIDVGEGTKEGDYAGKDVKGKIVLVNAQPSAVQDLAVGKFGALGIVSYAQNQRTAWWGENENLIRWGHLDAFSPNKTFAFMVSLKAARAWKQRLAKGEEILLNAEVRAGQHAGNYEVVTATIPGADPKLKDEEIAFSCHLDHQRPGANDNASGCATILEIARTLQKIISGPQTMEDWVKLNGTHIERPARTIRFIFPPEIEGTIALLNAKPEFAKRIKAVIHMDMVGGGPETKAVFHVTRGPMSLPSFVHDVAWSFAEWLNEESYKFAATGDAKYPMVAPEGGKEPLRAEYSAYTMGSDHDVYQDSSFGIPTIYLNDWPDRYIHTNFDSAANIDPTKLKRAAFIGAASGYFLALNEPDLRFSVKAIDWSASKVREAETQRRLTMSLSLLDSEACNFLKQNLDFETAIEASANSVPSRAVPGYQSTPYEDRYEKLFCSEPASKPARPSVGNDRNLSFRRNAKLKGPLAVFGYDYFADHAKTAGVATPKLLSYEGLWGSGEEYAYEVLNFTDGKRNVQQIRNAVSAEYGPVPFELVAEYLTALEKIGVVEKIK
jgi:aminopeptidase YwaD